MPEVFFAFSAAPAPGRPPDANRMDYALVACDAELPDAPFDASSDAASDAVSASRRADAKKRLRSFLFTRALEEARPSETCEPGDELHLGACDGGAERVSGVAWRRGFVTAPPRGARRDDEARAATATATVPLAREPPPDTRERSLRTTRVSLRYDARTTSGESGAAVTSAPRRAPGELDADFAARRKAAHLEGARGRGALVAMHRAGGDGEDGEGVMVCEILKDVKETLAAGKVRDAAGEGNAAVAVAELAREPRAASRGARSRAAAAAAEVVASLPEQAVQAMASWIDRGGTSRSGRRASRRRRRRSSRRCATGSRSTPGPRGWRRAPRTRSARSRARACAPRAAAAPGTRASSRRWTGTTRTRRSARRRGGRTACGAPGRLDEVYVLPLRVFVENPFYR